jgi:ATP-dependent DNA helicase RecG
VWHTRAMNDSELELALAGESPRVEWKQSDKNADILDAVCALANDLGASGAPGYVVLGMRKDGKLVGLEHADEASRDRAQQAIASQLSSIKILPNPSVDVHPREREGVWFMVLKVEPYAVPPIVKVNQTAWVRVGTVTRRANDADIARLNERRPENTRPFDLRVLPDATLDDLDLRELGSLHAAAKLDAGDPETFPDLEHWLRQRELIALRDGVWRPNAAAMLQFGLSPQSYVPGAYVEIVQYRGDDYESEVVARKTVTGTVSGQLDSIWQDITSRIVETPTADEGMKTHYGPQYPLNALKELARNMLQHRLYGGTSAPARISWFVDRVVFNNPGGPYGQASQGELGDHSDYRNPTLTRELVAQGYVERLGRGIVLARRALDKNGNPPLRVDTDGFTTITVRARQ